jgi:hypothetical protein
MSAASDRPACTLCVAKRARTLLIYGDMEYWLRKQLEAMPDCNPYVFHSSHGCPVDNHMLGWKEVCEQAGFSGLLSHDLAPVRDP